MVVFFNQIAVLIGVTILIALCRLQDVIGLNGMESDVSQDLQDYWNEIRIIQETKRLDEFLDEECGARDDGETMSLSLSTNVVYC